MSTRHIPNGGHCDKCVAGKYKSDPGDMDCTSCQNGKFGYEQGATSDYTCAPCTQGQFSAAGTCFEREIVGEGNYPTTRCDVYKVQWFPHCAEDNVYDICKCSCSGPNSYCPELIGPVIVPGINVCVTCPPGNSGDGRTCLSCFAGKYSSVPPGLDCIQCPENSFSSSGSSNITACVCNANSIGPPGGPCVRQCPDGTYMACTEPIRFGEANTECSVYKKDWFDYCADDNVCGTCKCSCSGPKSKCPELVGPVVVASTEKCVQCPPGTSGDGQTCTSCTSGKYSSVLPGKNCIECPENSFSPSRSTGNTECVCNNGYNGPNGGTCVQCLPGTYKSGTGNTGCVPCPINSSSPAISTSVIACVCKAGFFMFSSGSCMQCPVGKFRRSP